MTAPCPTLGFVVSMELARAADGWTSLADAWRSFLESRGLYCSGGVRGERLEYAVLSEAWQATEVDRASAQAWLAQRDDVKEWRVGELEDFGQMAI